jgi:phosphatidylglycerophosphatase A
MAAASYTFYRLVATGAYVGYCPIAPGTAGTVLAAAIYWVLRLDRLPVGGGCILLFFLLGVLSSGAMAKRMGPDPSPVVVDEMVGYWIAMLALPRGWAVAVAGFFLFRFFDIFKPFPIRRAEDLPFGWGIMADDVIAGLYTHLLLRLFLVVRG